MNLLKHFKFGKQTSTRSYSSIEARTPVSQISSVLDDAEEDDSDYFVSIQQEAAGILRQENERLMIEETNKALVQWSAECKKLTKKHNRLIQKKEAYFQPYTTTTNLFLVAISALEQVAAQFDESSEELNKTLQNLPKHEDPSIKSKFAQQKSILKKAKRHLDDLEKKREQINDKLDEIKENLGNCRLNTRKHDKLQQQRDKLRQERKKLKEDIQNEQDTYKTTQKQYRTNMENIYQQSQKKELNRLKNMSEPLKNFVTALKLDSASLQEAIQKHDPQADLTSFKKKHFSPSFKQTSV